MRNWGELVLKLEEELVKEKEAQIHHAKTM